MRPRLRPFEMSWTDAMFGAIYPEPRDLRAGRAPHAAHFFDDLLFEIPFEPSFGLRVALWVAALSPLFTLARFATFSSLSLRDRQRAFDKLLSSRIYVVRQLAISLKAMATMFYASSGPRAKASKAFAAAGHWLVPLRVKAGVEESKRTRGGRDHDHAAE